MRLVQEKGTVLFSTAAQPNKYSRPLSYDLINSLLHLGFIGNFPHHQEVGFANREGTGNLNDHELSGAFVPFVFLS
jgi:hypothetical protein